jgi:hypothetical protein
MAIPTVYAGVQFRSRLEARWAAFFGLLAWRWEYEPLDLAGYIPDFVLRFPYAPLLAEAKPALSHDAITTHDREKIRTSGWQGEALILGACVDTMSMFDGEVGAWGPAAVITCRRGHRAPISADYSFRCRYCGERSGDHHIAQWHDQDLEPLWREAGNRVQWRKPT